MGSVNQKQLAAELGVSQVTVSRALRDGRGVRPELRDRILAEAARVGYSIDASNYEARMMRGRALGARAKTNVLCAIVFDEDDPGGFGGRILKGMNREGAALGCEVVMVTRCTGQMPLIVSRRQVDGVLWMPADLDVARGAPAVPVPCVTLLYEIPGADLVTVDNFAGARAVGRRLCALGHRRIAFIGPTTDLARERLAGLRAAAAEAGATVPQDLVFLEKFVASDEPTADLLRRVLPAGSRPPFTALVAYNDFMADLALHHARAQGLRVPGDLSIAGFDGVLPSRLREPVTITSAAVPLEELGAAAVRMLAWRLSGPDAPRRKVTLETTLIEGATAGPP